MIGKTALLLFVSQAAFAGGWVSSGGELFKDAKNPWFVRNTEHVRYCVQVDEATVSASPRRIRELITQAISYWQGEFRRSMAGALPGAFAVATQSFEEIECAPGLEDVADVTFKVGYGTLTAEEIQKLEEPRKYIGVSVRKTYDEAGLRGHGFVFIASDKGPNAYENPTGTLLDEAWKQDQLLYYAFLHELGHVFGIPHTGSGLMSEVFLDQMLNKSIYEIFIESPVESFFYPDSRMESCDLSGADRAWFGVSMDYQCVAVTLSAVNADAPVYARKQGATTWDEVGAIRSIRINIWDVRNRPAVFLQLNAQQKIFSGQESGFRSFMIGAQFMDFGADAVYASKADNVPHSVYLRVTSNSFQMLGQQSGKMRIVFNYNSPISAKLFFSSQQP